MPSQAMCLISKAHSHLLRSINSLQSHLDAAKQDYYQSEKQSVELNELQRKCFLLDVGGQSFHVSSDSLLCGRSEFLATVASGDFASECGNDGYIFLDRDPLWFATVLSYVKTGSAILPYNYHQRSALYREMVFYRLNDDLGSLKKPQPHIVLLQLGHGTKHAIEAYNILADTWVTLSCPFLAHWEVLGGYAIGSHLHIAAQGSWNGERQKQFLLEYDTHSGVCNTISEIPIPLVTCQMEHIENTILLIGTSHAVGFNRRAIVQQFHLSTGKWHGHFEMRSTTKFSRSCLVNNDLVLLDAEGHLVIHRYNAAKKDWRLLTKTFLRHPGCAMAPFQGQVMVAGGVLTSWSRANRTQLCKLEIPICWKDDMPDLVTGRGQARAVSMGDEVYLLGGENDDGTFNPSMEVLKESSNGLHWRHLTILPMDSNAFVAAIVHI